MTSPTVIKGYSQAIYAIASVEDQLEQTANQLSVVAVAVAGNEKLRSAVSDRLLPAPTRSQLINDLLDNKATDVTNAVVQMIAAAGHGYALEDISRAFSSLCAGQRGRQMATVRSAVELTDLQKTRLASALSETVGAEVEINNIVDPSVVGGLITEIGDRVIDGSLKNKLDQVKKALS